MLLRDYRFPPRYGPEWGSGGIFGLKYHNGTLYFTLAFEAEAHFIDVKSGEEKTYDFTLLGGAPTSGGDTYNAVETVDEFIYFGGWVHAPAVYREDRRILFHNKYSHVHVYDTEEGTVKLLWKDSIHHETDWAGEVSDILYDPYNDRLLLAREDGHANLGVYALDRRTGKAEPLIHEPSLKGTIVHDAAFFGVGSNFTAGLREIRALDLITGKWEAFKPGDSVDGRPYIRPEYGPLASAYNRAFAFVRGGIIAGNPLMGEDFRFFRLFEFYTFYAPFRVNAINVGGGILTAYNAHHDVLYRPDGSLTWATTNTITGPSVLLYIAPPMVKIVGAFGARITGIEKVDGKLLIATNTTPNTGSTEATPFDTGSRDVVVLDEKIIQERPPAVSFSLPLALPGMARKLGGGTFGGIPLDGYREPRMVLYLSNDNRLTVYEYDLSLPAGEAVAETFDVKAGKNILELDSFSGIVSFELEKEDMKGKARIELR
ncbi:DUF2139 domain-containing protein [Thermococcus thioreducens]|uniref:Phosphate ABC transporter substrate-binding protein n=1 Tax=Thermococcus thioreducens TaxID=277988 RepID=A0A0Q2M5P9_9EURY|nr:DUF2139 domain-containing protein [Thermococcus thioreducens]ASJ13349.1 phosphate ABC transporter substrate-binding protein [Thermococcus thioreducens]KQH83242.1 phosphate ABC transporter substrate-binding protein [Thermococcus thioreducens]SEW23022.1 hypothetical protein SAMN05216170_2280 [Thermococcus thioreducens]